LETLARIKAALESLAGKLGLAEEDPQPVFDPEILVSAAELEEGVCRAFSLNLTKRAVALRLALSALVEESTPQMFARSLHELDRLIDEMDVELAAAPEGREWRICRQFHAVASHLAKPNPAENQSFRKLPEMLYTSPWVEQEIGRQLSAAGLSLPAHLRGKEFRRTPTQKWLDELSHAPAAALAARLDALRGDTEFRARQIWYLLRSNGEDADLPLIYGWAHDDLFPTLRRGLSSERLSAKVAELRALMLELRLPDFALCLEAPEWLAQYAMNYLMPPAPNEWAVEHGSHLLRVLSGRLARWYFYPFAHRLEPIEMAASVLRVGRPLFYERSVAHAALEYTLLEGFTFSSPNAPVYLEILAALEREFLILFDGYLLRQMSFPSLRTPEGWCEYLAALTALHYRNSAGLTLLAGYRQAYLDERGLRSPTEILYRSTRTHGSVN